MSVGATLIAGAPLNDHVRAPLPAAKWSACEPEATWVLSNAALPLAPAGAVSSIHDVFSEIDAGLVAAPMTEQALSVSDADFVAP